MKRLLPLALLLLASAARAAEEKETRNPDRWNTLQFTEGGSSSEKGDEIVYSNGPDVEHTERTLNANASVLALLPLTDSFSLTLGGGGTWTESDTGGAAAGGESDSDNSQITYAVSGRYYFEDPDSEAWVSSKNPDRWPSLGLTDNGVYTINYSAGNSNGNTAKALTTTNVDLTLDARWPLADAWTLLAGLEGARDYSRTDATAAANGAKSLTDEVTPDVGFRYYLVGKNLIADDADQNPDKWTMFSLTGSATDSVYGRSTIATATGSGPVRKTSGHAFNLTLGTRLPITNHASLSFTLGAGYSRSYVPFTAPGTNGSLTRTTPVAASASLRYFLF